jgi:hypothetical protein
MSELGLPTSCRTLCRSSCRRLLERIGMLHHRVGVFTSSGYHLPLAELAIPPAEASAL